MNVPRTRPDAAVFSRLPEAAYYQSMRRWSDVTEERRQQRHERRSKKSRSGAVLEDLKWQLETTKKKLDVKSIAVTQLADLVSNFHSQLTECGEIMWMQKVCWVCRLLCPHCLTSSQKQIDALSRYACPCLHCIGGSSSP